MTLSDFPNELPAVTLDFLNSRQLDPRINFSRASAASPDSSATVNGSTQQFDINVPRLSDQGLLIEEQRTNYLCKFMSPNYNNGPATYSTYSDDRFGTADNAHSWTFASETAGPTIGWNDPGSINIAGDGIQFTISCWAKANQNYQLRGNIQDDRRQTVNFIVNLTTEWQYFTFSTPADVDDDGNGLFFFRWIKGMGATTAPAGLKIDFAQANLERGGFPTSFIPTDPSAPNTTVTRAADVAEMPAAGVYNPAENTIINSDFGVAGGSDTLTIVGDGSVAKRTAVYSSHLTQDQTNAVAGKDDNWWEWRVLGSSFGLPGLYTDGQVSIDWGDGSAIETYAQSDTGGVTHTFTNGSGYHTIKFRLDSGTYIRPYVFNDAANRNKVISVGPCPDSMTVNMYRAFYGCTKLETCDATIVHGGSLNMTTAWRDCNNLLNVPFFDASSVTNFNDAWRFCSSLTSFPLLDMSSCENFGSAWYGCSGIESFPLIDTSSGITLANTWSNSGLTSFPVLDFSSGTNFNGTWANCTSLTSFPKLDLSTATNVASAWRLCTGLTSFPAIDFPNSIYFSNTWDGCRALTSFPVIDTSEGTAFDNCWNSCNNLTSFPTLNINKSTKFTGAWQNCNSLQDFPALFTSWAGTPADNCFVNAWTNCPALTATSVENILNSIDTSGQSAPASGVDITIDYDTSSGTPNITTAVTNLKSRGWTITLNGVAQ